MQNSFFTPLRQCAVALIAALAMLAFASCSDKDEPAKTPDPQTFAGELSTTIPSMPNFQAVTSAVEAKITWTNPEQTGAVINLGAFTIETGMPGRGYAIGAMEITGIDCSKDSNGAISLRQDAFSCQAGEYATTGSLTGEYKNGKLYFTIVYKPGSMPFDVKSAFTSK